jgi:hypothetical protein
VRIRNGDERREIPCGGGGFVGCAFDGGDGGGGSGDVVPGSRVRLSGLAIDTRETPIEDSDGEGSQKSFCEPPLTPL